MPFPLYIIDCFVIEKAPFTGNPAAVCLLEYDDDILDNEKQNLASEINLPTTSFVSLAWSKEAARNRDLEDSTNASETRTIRWYSKTNELIHCGHGTLAAAKVLFHLMSSYKPSTMKTTTIQFETKYNERLGATINWSNEMITLDVPANPCENLPPSFNGWYPKLIDAILGSKIELSDIKYSSGCKTLMLRIKDELKDPGLIAVNPDSIKMLELTQNHLDLIRSVVVTVKGDFGPSPSCDQNSTEENDPEGNTDDNGSNEDASDKGKSKKETITKQPHFYSRFFAPWDGVDEDPITGIGHSILAPYWAHEFGNPDMTSLYAKQLSRRGGEMHCLVRGDRVLLSGEARITIKGQLCN